jgi:hypothetical protein
MALREFEPLTAKYYPKIKDTAKYSDRPVLFRCAAYAPKEISSHRPIKGMITSATRWVIYTTDDKINFRHRGLVEIFGEKFKITQLVEDMTSTDVLGAGKFKDSYISKQMPKWMTLE